jgi:hypothetical protein
LRKLTKPSGPIFGANAAVAAPSPPVTLRITKIKHKKLKINFLI